MKLPFKSASMYRGQSLEINPEAETLSLLGETGETLATISWHTLIAYLQVSSAEIRRQTKRKYSRAPLGVKVSALTAEGHLRERLTSDVSGGGLFIQDRSAIQVGTTLMIKLFLPDDFAVPLHARGTVAWVRPEPMRPMFAAGIGVQFTDISDRGRDRLVRMVRTLEDGRSAS